jgi:hypothetical protein
VGGKMTELINLEKLPDEVRKSVEPYALKMLDLLGENICSIAVYGSAAGNDFVPKKSNVNLLIVCERVELSDLKTCFNLIKKGAKNRIVAPLFLTRRHMETSSDVFPIEFLDMRDFHQVIYGPLVFEGLEIGTENLRLECEEQLKGKLIRLRQVYLETGGKPKPVEGVLIESLSSLIPAFRGMIRLMGKEVPEARKQVLDAVSQEFGVDATILSRVLNIKNGKEKLDKNEIEGFFGKYLGEIEKLAIAVDKLEGESR